MLASISGVVTQLGADWVLIETGGIGYEIHITPRHSLQLSTGSEVTVVTRLVVREDDMSLFGFQSLEERNHFDHLCSVSGIGPKLALTVLSGMGPDQIADAIDRADEAAFRAISGIGPKTAKLIIISLGGKLAAAADPIRSRVVAALVQLGTDESRARSAVNSATGDDESSLLKQALSNLGSGKLS